MDIAEIQKRLAAMVVAMTDKGFEQPTAELRINPTGEYPECWLSSKGEREIGTFSTEIVRGDTISETLSAADAHIARQKTGSEADLEEYMKRVAKAADYGKGKGIDDEYVAPLRMTIKAMSDNLLEAK